MAGLGLLGVGFVAGDFLFFRRVFSRMNEVATLAPAVLEPLVEHLLGTVLLTALSTLAFSSLSTSLSALFLSRDLPLLLSSPIPTAAVFSTKQAEAWVQASYMVWLAVIPALWGYGAAVGAPTPYFLLVSAAMLLASVAPTCLGSFVILFLVRRFPARRLHQALSFSGLVLLILLVSMLRLLRPEALLQAGSLEELAGAAGRMAVPGGASLGAGWLARSMMASAAGSQGQMLQALAAISLLATLGISGLAVAERRLYRAGWNRSRSAGVPSPASRIRRSGWTWRPMLGRRAAALARKDLRIFVRDPSRWSQLVLVGALVLVYLFNIANLPAVPTARGLVAFLNLALTGFVLAAVGLRFAFTAASQEGAAITLLRCSPVGMGRYLWWKFATLAPLLGVLGLGLIWGSNRMLGVDAFVMTHALFAVAGLVVGLVGMGVGLGALWPRFDAMHPQEAATSPGGLAYMVLALTYLCGGRALLFRPLGRHILIGVLPDARFLPSGGVSSLIGIALLSMVVAAVPLAAGGRSLARRSF